MSDADRAKVLIVDDLPEKLLVYQTILEELGQELVLARSGPEALRLVLQHEFAVVLLDVNMPGMDGFETAALIRSRKRSAHTPIIFITSFADDVRIAEGYSHGAVDYILAPVSPATLRAKVLVFVNMHRLSREAQRQAEERLALAEERSRREAVEESNRRLEFLAKAGAVGASLDYDETLRELARLTVPALAEAAYIAQPGPGGSWQFLVARPGDANQVVVEQTDAARVPAALHEWARRPHPGTCSPDLFGGAAAPSAPRGATIVQPLVARGQTLAVMALERRPERPFDTADATLVRALANRAAVALDNAQLYSSVQRADRQKNEFLSMLAHELRNPLAPIRTGLETLRLCGPQDPLLSTTCDIMDRQVSHLVRLVDELLDVSRITQGKIRLQPVPVEAAELVNNALEMSRPLIDARAHELFVDLPAEPLWLEADTVRITQVISNLLNNAAKYMERGGRIWVSLVREGGWAALRVRDMGIGIPPDMLEKVFDLFVQADRSLDRSEGGLGVGLTLVRHLVEMHGGTIEAASAGLGRGSEFTVRLPLVEAPRGASAATTQADAAPRPAGRRIAVVDDNVDAADSLADLLSREGHEARVAYDGPAALELVRDFEPEIVLLDIGLPGMNGIDVARRLRTEPPARRMFIAAVTGYGREANGQVRAELFVVHLVKPVELAHVRTLLARAAATCGPRSARPASVGPRLHPSLVE
jgi:signal transduction histidine kinase